MTPTSMRVRATIIHCALVVTGCGSSAQKPVAQRPAQEAGTHPPAQSRAQAAATTSSCELPDSLARFVVCEPEAPRDTAWAPADTSSEPYRHFAAFLSLAVATREPHMGYVDSVYTSGDELGIDERYEERQWLAASRILSVETKNDTAQAAALITIVARQTADDDAHYTARYGIRDDTARWVLVRGVSTGGRWKVNGDAAGSFGVLPIGRYIRWAEGSQTKALAAVDSIRRTRGLELLR